MSIRRLIATATGGLMIAFAAGPMSPLHAQVGINADSKFIREVATDNLLEIRLGALAQKKATDTAVKQFGERMVTDHTRLLENWRALVKQSGFPFQPGLSDQQEQEFKQLDKMSGTEFDRAYMTAMINDHQKAIDKFQNEGRAASSTQVRDQVAADLPTLQQHLSMATQIASATTVATAGNNGPVTPTGQGNAPGQGPVPGQTPGQTTTPGPVVTQNVPVKQGHIKEDIKFIREIGADNFLEVRLGELAQRKAKNGDVKEFARREVTDHNRLQDQWTSMASRNGVPFKPGMGPLHEQKLKRLEKLSGKEFDKAYMTTVIQHHQDIVDYLRKEGRAANSAAVRDQVATILPVFEQHLSIAKQVGRQVRADITPTSSRKVTAEK